MIVGEESELCVRLRQRRWKVFRFDEEMTLHDAQIIEFGQCWERSVRAGHADGEGAWLHEKTPDCVKESRSIWVWEIILPTIALGLAPLTTSFSLLSPGSYPVLAYRIYPRQ